MCCVPLRHEMKSREGDRKFISNHYMAHIIQSAKHRDSLPRKLASFLAVSISYPGDWLQTASRTRPPLFHTGTWPRLRCWPGSGEPSQLQNNMCHQHHSPHEKCTLCVCVCVCVCVLATHCCRYSQRSGRSIWCQPDPVAWRLPWPPAPPSWCHGQPALPSPCLCTPKSPAHLRKFDTS